MEHVSTIPSEIGSTFSIDTKMEMEDALMI